VLRNSPCERIGKWETFPIFEREQIVGARIAGEFGKKPVTLIGVSRATVSKVISIYMSHGKTALAKRNNGRK
jgi:hypothetical protein